MSQMDRTTHVQAGVENLRCSGPQPVVKPGCGYVSLSSDRPWQPQLLERKSSRALPAGVEVHCSSHGSFLGREASPSLHLSRPRAAMRTSDKEIPAASGHGVEEEGGVSRAGFETFCID